MPYNTRSENNMDKRKLLVPVLAALLVAACQEKGTEPDAVPLLPPEEVWLSAVSDNSLTFSWTEVDGAVRYALRLELTSDGSLVLQTNTQESHYRFDGLEKEVSYTFKVRAVAEDDASSSEYSLEKVAVPGVSEPESGPVTPEPEPDPDVPEEVYGMFAVPEHESSLGALAFPGAEGGGMYTTGGRGGKVIHVTNLKDSGEGSLRDAINQSGARTIVFDVAGTISLKSELRVRNGDVTIAGQTAPGDGICLKDNTVRIDADNVVIRFMRFRLGDEGSGLSDGSDTIWGRYHENIILDHCSMSWSIDECASFYANRNFTMQWCILTESLRNSVHGKGSHGYGGIWGGEDASFHHNMLSCHDSRNPRFDHPEIYETPSDPDLRGNVDFRNNVIYNWGNNSTYGGEGGHFNMVNNYYRQGPASRDRAYFIDANGIYTSSGTDYGYPYLYMDGNFYYDYPSMTAQDGVFWHDDGTNTPPDQSRLLSSGLRISGPAGQATYITTHSASGAFDAVCAYGGASLRRDSVDERACSDAASGTATAVDGGNGSTGGIIDSQDAVGGWPEYTASEDELADILDTDGDGMPDWFETEFGLDPRDSSDGEAFTLDMYGRYDNLEMYLHYLVRDIVSGQAGGGEYLPVG